MATTNTTAIDLATARLTQGLSLLGMIETDFLNRVSDGDHLSTGEIRQIAQSIWGIKALFEQAQDAVHNITAGRPA